MGHPFVHLELSTDDVAGAQRFFKTVFGWKFKDTGPAMGNYILVDFGSKTQGGGLSKKMMPDQPTGWLGYVEVKDVKATVAKAQAAGAKIIVPFQEIGDMGAIGIFTDPTGGAIGVWAKGKAAARPKPAKKAAKKAKPAKKAGKKKKK